MTHEILNRRLVLASRPVGIPEPAHFRRDDQPVGKLGAGDILIHNKFLSVDPAQRGWVNASANYADPVPIGGVMRALAVGEVVASFDPAVKVGHFYYGWFGWQDYCLTQAPQLLARAHSANGPLSAALSVFGIPGMTACLALTDLGRPQPGETVVVSTAAGAVGSIVGQIARRMGCQVVGLTGSDEKLRQCVTEFGYHAALNYRHGLGAEKIKSLCPQGVDIFFDNTSGPIADAVWPHLRLHSRVIQCGTAAIARWDPVPEGPRRDRDILTRRITQRGFIIFDHVARFDAVIAQLASWVRDGSLVYREDIVEGLDNAPAMLAGLYRGDNRGKAVIKL